MSIHATRHTTDSDCIVHARYISPNPGPISSRLPAQTETLAS